MKKLAKKKKKRIHIPIKTQREIKIEAGHKCSVWNCPEKYGLVIHHIDHNTSNKDKNNLICLCRNHHQMADDDIISQQECHMYKEILKDKLEAFLGKKHEIETKEMFLTNFKKAATLFEKTKIILGRAINKNDTKLLGDKRLKELTENRWKYLITKTNYISELKCEENLYKMIKRGNPKKDALNFMKKVYIAVDDDKFFSELERYKKNGNIIVWTIDRGEFKDITIANIEDISGLSIENVIKQYEEKKLTLTSEISGEYLENPLVWERRLFELKKRKEYLQKLADELATISY
jgi:hypothetical protein